MNGRSRPVIFEDMQRRISRGDINLERREAIQVRGCVQTLENNLLLTPLNAGDV